MINKYRLLEKIAASGFTQQTLAKKMKMSNQSLNAKINGKSYFNTRQIDEICEILRIDDDADKIAIFLSDSSQKRDAVNNTPA